MLVSIITPTYNSEKFIGETYESLCSQTYNTWEWIITDDCSSDNTVQVLKKIAQEDSRVKIFVNVENLGAAHTRNNSLSHAQGEYIAFIDSDDKWHPEKLKRQLDIMNNNNISFSFTGFIMTDETGRKLGKRVDCNRSEGFKVNYVDMLKKKVTLGCSTVMLKADSFKNIEMPNLRTGQDYALWLKLLKQEKYAYLVSEGLSFYRVHKNSISRNKLKKALRQWEIYRNLEGLGILKASYCFAFYAYRAVVRK
ncbi:TPA: glycosyltransferase family 2 protein [Serratia fonticola]